MAKKPALPRPAVKVVPLSSVSHDLANVRVRDAETEGMLEASLRQFGAGRSIVLDGNDVVRAGNGTLKAAAAVGFQEVILVEPQPGQLVAVKRPEWSATEAAAYGIADNRLAERATWDEPALAAQLEAIRADGFDDFRAVGFSDEEMAATFSEIELADPDGEGSPGTPGETIPLAGKGEVSSPLSYLAWGDRKVPLTGEEAAALDAALARHQEAAGTSYGFVAGLLHV